MVEPGEEVRMAAFGREESGREGSVEGLKEKKSAMSLIL